MLPLQIFHQFIRPFSAAMSKNMLMIFHKKDYLPEIPHLPHCKRCAACIEATAILIFTTSEMKCRVRISDVHVSYCIFIDCCFITLNKFIQIQIFQQRTKIEHKIKLKILEKKWGKPLYINSVP